MAIVFTALTAMPPGLTLGSDGKISGTPTASFSGSVQIQATDGAATATGLIDFSIDLPRIPAPPIIRSIAYETFVTPFLAKGPEFINYTSWTSYTMEAIALNSLISYNSFSTYTVDDPTVRYTSFSTPFGSQLPVQSYETLSTPFGTFTSGGGGGGGGGFSSTIAIPQGISGLTQIADNINDPIDDHVVNVGDVGFDFSILSIANARNTTCVCSNSHLGFQFATAANNWNGFAEDYPQQVGLYLGAGDWSHIGIWKGGDTSKFRIRYEGRSDRSGQLPATAIWEVTIWPNGVIMVVTGDFDLTGYTAIQTGFTGESVPFSIGPNTSRVLTPVPGGMFSPPTYTVQTGSYS